MFPLTGSLIRRSLWLCLCIAAGLCLTGCATPNLPAVKQRIVDYYEGGAFDKDMARSFARARTLLPARGSYNIDGKAVVLDIDDTVLSTYEFQKSMGFGINGKLWHSWLMLRRAKAIPAALDFYTIAQRRGLAVFFVSGRRESFRTATEENLRAAGFDHWKGLYMKPDTFKEKSVVGLKTAARIDIEKKGYKIILNIGDQQSDLDGGHALHRVLLPNAIYHVK